MRLAPNLDKNHKEVAEYFRRLGWAVYSTAGLAGGFPDLIVSNPQATDIWLVEIKDGIKAKLTADQLRFNRNWTGKKVVRINGAKDVLEFHIKNGGVDVGSSF